MSFGSGIFLRALVDALDLCLLLDDAAAQFDALVTDICRWAGDELLHLVLRLPAE